MTKTKSAHGVAVQVKECMTVQLAASATELALSQLKQRMRYENIFCNHGYWVSMSSMDGFG
jgi:hypothetical protein